ncbi:MAG: GxxExxY protein [Planctomycetia bacterium]|nr:GxxExxY protein [Planctomycetia bacterium]
MLPFESLTARIIGASFRIHNSLGSGFLEHVYRNALAHELEAEGLSVRVEPSFPVEYSGITVGFCRADLVVENLVVVETKAQEAILPGHRAQLGAYLRCSGCDAGLVVNFGPEKVEVKRVVAGGRTSRAV